MRYVTFTDARGDLRAGVVDGDRVAPLAVNCLEDLIAADARQRSELLARAGESVPLASVQLLAPLHPKKNVFCVGRNYMAHAEEGARARGETLKLPSVPTFFTKAPTAVVGPDAEITLDGSLSAQYDYEAELAVVIGRTCRDVREADALDVIFGYTALNDLTARDLQSAHGQWFKGKSLDGSCPIGPWIVDAEEFGDPQDTVVRLRRNGIVRQEASTSTMIFSVARIIAVLSRGITLEPGDIIATGTPEGVGFARTPPEFIEDGDVIEVDIDRIGVLRNRIAVRTPQPATA